MSKAQAPVDVLNEKLKLLGPSFFAREKNGLLQICQSFGTGVEVVVEGDSPDAALEALATPKRKITLSGPQVAFLRKLKDRSRSAVENYKPALKLVKVGFAVRFEKSASNPRFEITDAGLAYLEGADKTCSRCKTASWTCRVCARKTCEHFCRLKKPDGTALCGRLSCSK